MVPRENLVVYETLRNTIISCEERIANETIYMYVIYFTVFSLGFKFNWLALVSIGILIVFQTMINTDQLAIDRASVYIEIFFENVRGDIHWELINRDLLHNLAFYESDRSIGWYINKYSASILGSASLVLFYSSLFKQYDYDIQPILENHAMEVVLSVVLYLIVVHLNRRLFFNRNEGKQKIVESVQAFYEKAYGSNKNST